MTPNNGHSDSIPERFIYKQDEFVKLLPSEQMSCDM